MLQLSPPKNANETQETEKVPFLVVKKVPEAILDEVFKPGDRLGELELAEKFEVSRSPVREALLALEKEGTVIISPYKGAIVKLLFAGNLHLSSTAPRFGMNKQAVALVTYPFRGLYLDPVGDSPLVFSRVSLRRP